MAGLKIRIKGALQALGEGHFHLLLVILLTSIFLKGFEAEYPRTRGLSSLGIALVIFAALRVIARSARGRHASWVVLGLWLAIEAGVNVFDVDEGLALSILIPIFGWIIVQLVLTLVRMKHVSAQVISASLCAYLLIGFWFWTAYGLVFALDHGAFSPIVPASEEGAEGRLDGYLFYFSFVTLTSLGYGDVLPVSAMARTLAILEVIFGQFYLAVLIARQVGLYLVQKHSQPPR